MKRYNKDGEVTAIYLQKDYIGKGYGRRLLAEVEQALAAKGYTHFVLDVLRGNTRAVLFYPGTWIYKSCRKLAYAGQRRILFDCHAEEKLLRRSSPAKKQSGKSLYFGIIKLMIIKAI